MKIRFLIIYLLTWIFSWSADEITLNSGETLKGLIDDKRETSTEVVIDVSTLRGVSDFKTILKSDIGTIKRSDGAEEEAMKLVLPSESQEIKWYDENIEKLLKPWIAKYSQSPILAEGQKKLADFEAEKARVKAGDIKMSDRWYTRTEFEEVRTDVDALKFYFEIKELTSRKDFSELLKRKARINAYKNSEHFDKIVEIFREGYKEFQSGGYEELIRKQVENLEFTMKQNEKWIREAVNEKIPTTTFASDDILEWETLRSSGLTEALRRNSRATTSSASIAAERQLTSADESRYYVRFGGELYPVSSVLQEWNKADTAIQEFVQDFKKYYSDANGPKYRISSSKMVELRKLASAIQESGDKIKEIKKESQSIGQFEDRIQKALAELDTLRIENFKVAQEAVKAAYLAHETRDYNVTNSELRGATQAWPGLISIDRAVKKMAVDYFNDGKAFIEKGDYDQAFKYLDNAQKLIPIAKARFISLVTLKTDLNKYMAENKQMIELAKKKELEEKKKEQEQLAFIKKFEEDYKRGDYLAISRMVMLPLEGSDQLATFEEKKKQATENMTKSKELAQQVRPLIESKKATEALNILTEAKTNWPLNPALSDLYVAVNTALKPKTILDVIEENLIVSIVGFFTVFLGIAYGVARYLSK